MRHPLLDPRLILLASLMLWGCSSSNEGAVSVDPAGKHQPGWTLSHGPSYLQDASVCRGCHGADLTGGISRVSCSSSSFEGLSCHATGPHPVPWPTHNLTVNQLVNCTPCHGAGLAGGRIAPPCTECHTQLPPGAVPVLGNCISCHDKPPNGAIFPNISGGHKAHTDLPLTCAVCHTGGGSGTATHGITLTVAFPAVYNAKNGAAGMNPDNSCTSVSCHGGKTTPRWRGGRIDPLTECTVCHEAGTAAGTPQANSYFSGEHAKHLVDIGLICTDCHDMSAVSGGASHFSGLATPAFELSPATTMRPQLNFASGARSCSPGPTPPAGAFSIGVCHTAKNW